VGKTRLPEFLPDGVRKSPLPCCWNTYTAKGLLMCWIFSIKKFNDFWWQATLNHGRAIGDYEQRYYSRCGTRIVFIFINRRSGKLSEQSGTDFTLSFPDCWQYVLSGNQGGLPFYVSNNVLVRWVEFDLAWFRSNIRQLKDEMPWVKKDGQLLAWFRWVYFTCGKFLLCEWRDFFWS